MFDVGTTKMSSKGQVVIPADLRGDFKEGDKFVLIRKENMLLFKKVSSAEAKFAEDLEFARRTANAWKEVDQGKTKKHQTWEQFKKELDRVKARASNAPSDSSRRTRN